MVGHGRRLGTRGVEAVAHGKLGAVEHGGLGVTVQVHFSHSQWRTTGPVDNYALRAAPSALRTECVPADTDPKLPLPRCCDRYNRTQRPALD